jgi:replicative DNA helicase
MNQFLTLDKLETRVLEELRNPPEGIQLPYWPTFNVMTGGLRGGELTLVTSGTGTGKTTFLANIATRKEKMATSAQGGTDSVCSLRRSN